MKAVRLEFMKRKDFREALKRYQAGCASEEEIQIVEKWFDAMGMQQSDITDMDEAMLEQQYWSGIMKQVDKTRVHTLSTHRTRTYRYVTGIAATFLLVAVSLFFLIDKTPEQQGQRTTVEDNAITWTHLTNVDSKSLRHSLPDGSTVTLKPQSTIRYSSLFNMSVREVYLEGEGFFEVAKSKDKPFLVYANEITTRVLGTSFIVRAFDYDNKITVAVKSGKVSVKTKPKTDTNNDEIILTPNQEIVYDKSDKVVARRIVEKPEPIVSQEEVERMRFEEAPLQEIFEAIEKIYGVEIEFDEEKFASCTLTTSVSGGGLYNRLDIITSAIGAEYELSETRIVIKGAGCK